MDGLRKVPENLPNAEMIRENLGKPLTAIPDPFGTHESFGAHMNARLQAFLDTFGFAYEFKSSTATYQSGEFDKTLLTLLARYDDVMKVMLPTLGEERQQTYSPFLPVSPRSGKVLLAKVVGRDVGSGTITYIEEDGSEETVPVTGGHCKLQWKPDMGMRWAALGVDYEMYGKDHLSSAKLYDAICKIAGGRPPQQFMFELFLDEKGEKISKSRGNGLTIDEWLAYAPQESLAYYMYQNPRRAKKLYFDVIPQQTDEYLQFLEKYEQARHPVAPEGRAQDLVQQGQSSRDPVLTPLANASVAPRDDVDNPVWHIHSGHPPKPESGLRFGLLLNLASVSNPEDKSVLWRYISRYLPDANPHSMPFLDKLAGYAVRYYQDFVRPNKRYRLPDEKERAALSELAAWLEAAPDSVTGDEIQHQVFEIGKAHGFTELKAWFKALYETLLGQPTGPRMGTFIALFGHAESAALIRRALAGELVQS
jgi:lysyl-tRNA synthetase class 1